jgi:hypothetical protein
MKMNKVLIIIIMVIGLNCLNKEIKKNRFVYDLGNADTFSIMDYSDSTILR